MAKLSTKERNKLDDSDFGLPDKRMYPLHDKAHVESAVKLFGHCPKEDKPRLARRILEKAKEYGMDSSGWDEVNKWAKEGADEVKQESFVDKYRTRKPAFGMQKATKDDIDFIAEMEMMTISEQTKRDYPNIEKFIRKDAQKSWKDTWLIWLGSEPNVYSGIYQAYPIDDGEWWYIAEIALKPECRGKGIGTWLITEDMLKHDKIVLCVDMYNTKARRLYERLGFKKTDKEQNRYIMRWEKPKNFQEAVIESDEPGDHKVTFKVIKNAISKIHDKYKKDSKPPTGNQNCLLCAWCFLADWYGRILPRAVYSPRDPALDIKPEDMLIGKVHKVKAEDKRELLKRISDLSKHDDLAFWYCHVGWKGCSGGHEFVILNTLDEGTFVIDPQQGLFADVTSKEGRRYFDDADYSRTYAVRAEGSGHAKNINIDKLKEINSADKIIQWDNKKDSLYLIKNHGMSKEDIIWATENKWFTIDELERLLKDDEIPDRTKKNIRGAISECRIRRVPTPSKEGVKYLKSDPELKDNWEWFNDKNNCVGEFLVDRETGEQIGHVFVWTDNDNKGFIFNVNVDKKYRRQGYGWILVDDAVNNLGGRDLTVDCDNEPAVKLYLKYGFKIYKKGQWNHDPPKDEYWMKYDKKSKPVQESFMDEYDPDTWVERLEYFENGEPVGIYEALKREMYRQTGNGDAWKAFLDLPEVKKLPKPPEYKEGYRSWFTPLGIKEILNPIKEIINEYIPLEKWDKDSNTGVIDISKPMSAFKREAIVYSDQYQFVVDTNMEYENVQESYQKLSEELIPVENYKHDTVYLGMSDSGFRKKKVYFVTPYMGVASIFAAHDAFVHKLNEMGLHSFNSAYDEWNAPAKDLKEPLHTVHVKIRSYEGKTFKKFEIKGTGYIFAIDISNLKDNIYVYPWMTKSREVLIANKQTVPVKECYPIEVKYIVEPEETVQEEYVEEAFHFTPSGRKLFFHVSPDSFLDGHVFKPRVPKYIEPYDPTDKYFENSTTPRVCFSSTIEGCLNGIMVNMPRVNTMRETRMYVYIPEKPINQYKIKTTKDLIRDREVYDANVTGEIWVLEPVRLKLYGVIEIDQVSNVKRKKTVPTEHGDYDKRRIYKFKWHWLVKPKVMASSEYKYDTTSVLNNLDWELGKFKYGLIVDGRVNTQASRKDYDKWVFHTGEEVDQAGGGICYDYVEYEAGYLDAYGVKFKKYFISCTYKDKVATHTFVTVEDKGKVQYIEAAFELVVKDWNKGGKFKTYIKPFDSIKDVFKYVLKKMVEYDKVPEFQYGIWDYTGEEFKPGTSMREFQKWIVDECKMVDEGTVSAENKGE